MVGRRGRSRSPGDAAQGTGSRPGSWPALLRLDRARPAPASPACARSPFRTLHTSHFFGRPGHRRARLGLRRRTPAAPSSTQSLDAASTSMEEALQTALRDPRRTSRTSRLLARAATDQLLTARPLAARARPAHRRADQRRARPSIASGVRSPPSVPRSPRARQHHQGRHERSWRPSSLFTRRCSGLIVCAK